MGYIPPVRLSQPTHHSTPDASRRVRSVACVAVIGTENDPLYFKVLSTSGFDGGEEATQLHYTVHAALDVIEDRGAIPPENKMPTRRALRLIRLRGSVSCARGTAARAAPGSALSD